MLCATRQPQPASMFASLRLPDWSSVKSWVLRVQPGCVFAPKLLPVSDPVLHLSALVCRGAVANARLGLT